MNHALMDPVATRRSIRRYLDTPINDEQIHALLSAAMCAPSADDERPWHFIVVKNPEIRGKLAGLSTFTHVVNYAYAAVVICGDEMLQKQQGCWMLDCAASTENILIEAQLLGLGAVWLGVYPVEGRVQRARQILKVPRNVIPFAIVALGYPAEYKEPSHRYDGRRVHTDFWTNGKHSNDS